ncbi:hypothetical protein scyTo_0015453 [Scyliorhinus torazame]|uniref:Transmembrane protein 138 n=1 Tax=Scyliorhinus torazame TaxID=75743 RepID=A0A401PT12_SCYTO|nr:hypothetical protein [Scyliorhinus torazame]
MFIIQDIGILFNIIIIFLMFFNTFIFQAGLVKLLIHRFTGTIVVTGIYFVLSVSFHVWIQNLRWWNMRMYVWTDGLQALFVFQRFAAVLYYYFYKRTILCLGDPRLYEDSEWLRNEFFRNKGKPPPVLSLPSLEVLLLLNSWYYAAYFVAEILLFVYKSLLLPYTPANLTLDLVMLFLYLGVEVIRIFFGSKGNLSQRKVPFTISLVLLGPSTIMAIYYMLLQTYVLRLEVTINAILLVFYVFELLLYSVGLISFSRAIIID